MRDVEGEAPSGQWQHLHDVEQRRLGLTMVEVQVLPHADEPVGDVDRVDLAEGQLGLADGHAGPTRLEHLTGGDHEAESVQESRRRSEVDTRQHELGVPEPLSEADRVGPWSAALDPLDRPAVMANAVVQVLHHLFVGGSIAHVAHAAMVGTGV